MQIIQNKWPSLFQTPFWTKLLHWEYWPVYITNVPTVLFWLYFALQARKLFFFSAVNPVIETGGVLGESKINILNRIPSECLPKTIFIKKEEQTLEGILKKIKEEGIDFPLIVKPDIGERGFLVEKIKDQDNLARHLQKIKVDFLIQEYVDYPLEASVLYYRLPNASKGVITSFCVKEALTVRGDGQSTVETLMKAYPRAALQLSRFRQAYPKRLSQIPANGQKLVLEPIGNHCRGTTFLNGNHYIDTQLETVFDKIGFQMENIYYGRFDFKYQSIEDLKKGKHFKILEFNGVAGEPAHIYDPDYPILQAYKDIFQHWKIIYQISQLQAAKGVPSMNWKEVIDSVKTYRHYMKNAVNYKE